MDHLTPKLHVFDSFPTDLLSVEVVEIDTVLPGPSLIYVPGALEPPVFVSSLLHGDETTGFQAIQKLIAKYKNQNEQLPRSLLIFLGNIPATRYQVRHLPTQPDYNRIWKGGNLPENRLAGEVFQKAETNGIFCGIDIHNTSGRNPHLGCVSQIDAACLSLASIFSRTLVYVTRPEEILSNAFSQIAPSVTIEAGLPGELFGVQHVSDYLEKCLRMQKFPDSLNGKNDFDLFQTVARIEVPPEARIGFSEEQENLDICFIENLDFLNFSDLPEKTLFGWRYNKSFKLLVLDENEKDVGNDYFEYPNKEIQLKRSVVMSMLTQNVSAVYQDCLGYIMNRYPLPKHLKRFQG